MGMLAVSSGLAGWLTFDTPVGALIVVPAATLFMLCQVRLRRLLKTHAD